MKGGLGPTVHVRGESNAPRLCTNFSSLTISIYNILTRKILFPLLIQRDIWTTDALSHGQHIPHKEEAYKWKTFHLQRTVGHVQFSLMRGDIVQL